MKQLMLFKEEKSLEKEMEDLRTDYNKLRKALFGQQADLRKQYTELAHEHQLLKLNICKGRIVL